MASVVSGKNKSGRKRYRVAFRDQHGHRKFIRLPAVSKRDASEVAIKVQAVVSARISGAPLSNAIASWLDDLGDDLHAKLATAGLVGQRRSATLGEFLDACIEEWESREGAAKPAARTVINWRAARGKLCEGLGEETPLRAISEQQAHAWRAALANKHAPATVSSHVKRAKRFFREAVKRGYLTSSPFQDIVAGDDSNEQRKAYVPVSSIDRLLSVAPDSEWRLLIALARFGGLRTPSETLRLKWADIDWEAGVIRVSSPKTAGRGRAGRFVWFQSSLSWSSTFVTRTRPHPRALSTASLATVAAK